MRSCRYGQCDRRGRLPRSLRGTARQYRYCGHHDPLQDPRVADYWSTPTHE